MHYKDTLISMSRLLSDSHNTYYQTFNKPDLSAHRTVLYICIVPLLQVVLCLCLHISNANKQWLTHLHEFWQAAWHGLFAFRMSVYKEFVKKVLTWNWPLRWLLSNWIKNYLLSYCLQIIVMFSKIGICVPGCLCAILHSYQSFSRCLTGCLSQGFHCKRPE